MAKPAVREAGIRPAAAQVAGGWSHGEDHTGGRRDQLSRGVSVPKQYLTGWWLKLITSEDYMSKSIGMMIPNCIYIYICMYV